jgi:hypothetical protein
MQKAQDQFDKYRQLLERIKNKQREVNETYQI